MTEWDKMKMLNQILKHKLLFLETKDVVETTLALDNFKRACDSGVGAIFLSIARGKVRVQSYQNAENGKKIIFMIKKHAFLRSHSSSCINYSDEGNDSLVNSTSLCACALRLIWLR